MLGVQFDYKNVTTKILARDALQTHHLENV